MKEVIISFTRKLASSLNKILALLENQNLSTSMQSKFVDLAPTDGADKTGVYSEALLFATTNAKVFNIALTGPYGSGKSSIIQSFLKKYPLSALHISLAAFEPEGGSEKKGGNRQDIERSILQQMLYGAEANNLPLSRFKRIQSPGIGACFKSLYIMLGILSLWYVVPQLRDISSGYFSLSFTFSNWFNLLTVFLAVTFLWSALHNFYVASFGLSLKSISLKDVEIKPANDDQTSILNRHLDEIIYFFQSTKYKLVVIEDLDRFEDAEIFVTLREINRLINENSGVKRPIRFIYALRDDMFVNIDRTKFFEFIIPVIPIINTSNSIDLVLEQGKRLELNGRLDSQFLREVSRYLNDLRLIQNIFNEYAVYVGNLEADGENLRNANKLLAILIYKNVYPSDFEELHRGQGTLYEILKLKDKLIEVSEAAYKSEISELEMRLEVAEQQIPLDMSELKKVYAMTLIEKLPEGFDRVRTEQTSWIHVSQLAKCEEFEQLVQMNRLICGNSRGNQQQVDISTLSSENGSNKSYEQRKVEIENKEADTKNSILIQIRDIRAKIAVLRTTNLYELLRSNPYAAENRFDEFGSNGDLARYLILEGYLDDTYYQYTSLFHSGRLSPNDNKFLIQIRAFITPEPIFVIDNPKEVIIAMREEDFSQSYALNVKLVDCILSEPHLYRGLTQKLFEFIASEFDSCEDFFDAFYTSGVNVSGLLVGLTNSWDSFVLKAIDSRNNVAHISQILSHLPEITLKKLAEDFDELSAFIEENLSEILVNIPELAPERLAILNVEVKDLAAIKAHFEIVRFMFSKSLFNLTIGNLEYVYQEILGNIDLEPMHKMNFTTIRAANNPALMTRIKRDFDLYLHDVLLGLQGNANEDVESILALLRHETLDEANLEKFIQRQTRLIPDLNEVPEKWYSMLFNLSAIEPTWSNCLAFINSKVFEKEVLIRYLERQNIRTAILKHPISSEPDSLKLRQFIYHAGSLSDSAYREYVRALPRSFGEPPKGFEPSKLLILISERKITFGKDAFDNLSEHLELQIQFLAVNISLFLSEPDKFALDDDFFEELLKTDIDSAAKVKIVKLMDLERLDEFPKRAALVGSTIFNTNANISEINGTIAQSLVRHSSPISTQISLLNRYQSLMTHREVREILTNLPKPYSTITLGYHVPKLKNSPENLELVKWLDSRNIISSWSDKSLFSDEIKVNLYRGP